MIDTPPLKYPDAWWTENGVAAAKEGETHTHAHRETSVFILVRKTCQPASHSSNSTQVKVLHGFLIGLTWFCQIPLRCQTQKAVRQALCVNIDHNSEARLGTFLQHVPSAQRGFTQLWAAFGASTSRFFLKGLSATSTSEVMNSF